MICTYITRLITTLLWVWQQDLLWIHSPRFGMKMAIINWKPSPRAYTKNVKSAPLNSVTIWLVIMCCHPSVNASFCLLTHSRPQKQCPPPFQEKDHINNVPCCLYGAGRNDFEASKSISRAIVRGGSLKIKTFWALKWQRAKRVP